MATWDITKLSTEIEFDPINGKQASNIIELDSTHYIVAYQGLLSDGYVNIFALDRSTWSLSTVTNFNFDIDNCINPKLFKLSATKVLVIYGSTGNDGFALILNINPTTWAVTLGTPFEFDPVFFNGGSIEQLDATHFLITYKGSTTSFAYSRVLVVDTINDTVAYTGGLFQASSFVANNVSTAKIDSNHVLLIHNDIISNPSVARVLEVNMSTWEVSAVGTPFALDSMITSSGGSATNKIDANHFVVTYTQAPLFAVQSQVLAVDLSTWNVTAAGPEYVLDSGAMGTSAHMTIDSNHVIATMKDNINNNITTVLEIANDTYAVSEPGARLLIDAVIGAGWSSVSPILSGTTDKAIIVYEGTDSDGFAVVINIELPVVTTVAIRSTVMGTGGRKQAKLAGMRSRRFARYPISGSFPQE